MQHIHIYFNETAKETAMELREKIATEFPDLHLGNVHDNPVGPHPVGSYLVILPDEQEAIVRAFLEANHNGLSIMFHPLSGDDAHDHQDENVSWIGEPLPLNHDAFGPN